ncbi:uncharacterized protein LOC106866302 [Brachypodium distachyon]|uniref:uncharacterized protein LOC106866302 n=1 Tax=Brachypodium distachyon TaxID=15368 RepID=UPI00071D0D75|nr:uncharacterized protein LOC106866302 [Brachypodium distachyon]|eukprot:XP_014755568.1 uncharacterized protein LOC106866302 [Brachypodium distachyon]
MYIILRQLPQPDILRGAGLACSSWRQVATDEPLLWRHIDLAAANEDAPPAWPWAAMGWLPMACAAVDRSASRCESFRGRVDFDFLLYLADKAPSLRSLEITSWFSTMDWFTTDQQQFVDGVIKKLPLLEKFVVSSGRFYGPVCRLSSTTARGSGRSTSAAAG